MALFVTGDTHGEEGRFVYGDSAMRKTLTEADKLFVCGDFGYIFSDDFRERKFLRWMSEEIPFQILFVDGNHENFDVIDSFPVEEWCGGKVHIVGRDKQDNPKIIHLMRGQVFEIEGKKIFTFGGGYSIDKAMRTQGVSWWPQEMPNDAEMKEAGENLKKHDYKVDYILTHTAPEDTMNLFHPDHAKEQPLNNFLEWVRETVSYEQWWFGHLHMDRELFRKQTALLFDVRRMETNELLEEETNELLEEETESQQ